ncbi:hypothetical protein [Fodinicola feengrottensis]|uniref:Uncharacterized protein n=1 Tax=Fodinicola feengrottensis TaxID=435914 RepID=A0ABP4UCY8_9ACTN|nr:hypothetical protein [Fodinicola feengrottensis]
MNGLLVAADVALLLVMCTVPALLVRMFLNAGRAASWLSEHWHDWRCGPAPAGPPLERTAATLRRLRTMIDSPQHLSATRYHGIQLAYDRTLSDACAALGIAEDLCSTCGFAHSIERVRIEAELEHAGFSFANPTQNHHPC